MADSPAPPPRRRLSSTSGAMAAVRPENVAKAVDDLQVAYERVRWRLDAHEERIDDEEKTRAKLEETVTRRFDDNDRKSDDILSEVIKLRMYVAKAEGQGTVWKVAAAVIPMVVAIIAIVVAYAAHK